MVRAYAVKEILENMTIYIKDGELIVGNQSVDERTAPLFPEYAVDWIVDEINTKGCPLRCHGVLTLKHRSWKMNFDKADSLNFSLFHFLKQILSLILFLSFFFNFSDIVKIPSFFLL